MPSDNRLVATGEERELSVDHRVTTFCRVCEPACGLIATVSEGRLTKLQPDRDHPITQGFACPKGLAGAEIHNDPDRLNFPFQRGADGERVRRSWDDAISAIAAETRRIVDTYGSQAVASYAGNPTGFNSLLGAGLPDVLRRLGVRRYFNAGTQDCVNKYAGSNAVFGSAYLHPIPDIGSADLILLIGSNWRASKASFISLPAPYAKLMEAAKRGAKIHFVNPRVTESSDERTGPTLQILPDTDVYLLAAMLHEIDRSLGFHPIVERHGNHVDELRAFVARYSPERVAPVCGVSAEEIVELAQEFATAPSATVHMSTGVNQGRQGTLAYWLLHMLAFVTGNLDRPGGNVISRGYYDIASKGRSDYGAGFVDGEFGTMRTGEIPGGLLASYILDAAEPVRALFIVGGNPLLSLPGQELLEKAFEALELLVVIDIYPTATAEHADWVLPATDQFERADLCTSGLAMQPRPWVQFTPRVAEPQYERREEWWIFARLAQELGVESLLDEDDPDEAKWSRIDHMLSASGFTRAELLESPHGLPLGEGLTSGSFFDSGIQTVDGRADCCPEALAAGFDRCERIFQDLETAPADQLWLISRRDSRMHNSWYMNVPGMKKGDRTENRMAISSGDAERLGLQDRDRVTVASAWGAIEVGVELDDHLRRGVVSLEHGWGLQPSLRHSRAAAGVNVNALMPRGATSFEALSNQQHLTGIPVVVERAAERGA
jgi:formate dehydrogenase